MVKEEKAAKKTPPDPLAGKKKALSLALEHIEKQFGKGTVMQLGTKAASLKVEHIPTGALSLDLALGIGGLPRGRVVEIYGQEASGKTTLALQVVANAQKAAIQSSIDVLNPGLRQGDRRQPGRSPDLPA